MKKLVILALVVMLLPAVAQGYDLKQGDSAFAYQFASVGDTVEVIRGETWCDYLYVMDFGWISGTCTSELDTFAVVTGELEGWPIDHTFAAFEQGTEGEDAESKCYILDGYTGSWYFVTEACISVPCTAQVGDYNMLSAQIAYCDEFMVAQPDSGDCEDPNVWNDTPRYYQTYQEFVVVESPPALYVLQDTLYYVQAGVTQAYIPFAICNGDPCAPATDYDYLITSLGTVGGAISQTGTLVGVAGGTCDDVYGVINAGLAEVCTYDTLTIIAWDAATGTVYDTCVQAIHIIEPIPVPLFTAPVVTILVLAMILAAAVIMKRHAVSKA